MGYRSSNKTVYSAKYHIIWCPKYRRRVLSGPVEARLEEIIAVVVAEVSPAVPLSTLVHKLKSRSSQLPRVESAHLRRLPPWWRQSWFVSTVGGAPLEPVRRDVENQKRAA